MPTRYRPARCSAATWKTYLQAAADARAAEAIDTVYRRILSG